MKQDENDEEKGRKVLEEGEQGKGKAETEIDERVVSISLSNMVADAAQVYCENEDMHSDSGTNRRTPKHELRRNTLQLTSTKSVGKAETDSKKEGNESDVRRDESWNVQTSDKRFERKYEIASRYERENYKTWSETSMNKSVDDNKSRNNNRNSSNSNKRINYIRKCASVSDVPKGANNEMTCRRSVPTTAEEREFSHTADKKKSVVVKNATGTTICADDREEENNSGSDSDTCTSGMGERRMAKAKKVRKKLMERNIEKVMKVRK